MAALLDILTHDWAIRALITSCIVGVTCGLLGCFIVLKNMSLIGDALSHSILPGIYVAFVIFGYSTLGFFIGSVVAGLLTAVAITYIQTNVKTKSDAAIGIVFTAMFALGVIGISSLNQKQGNHLDLKDFLFGSVLGVGNDDIILGIMVLLYTIVSVIVFYRPLFLTTFQPVIAETMGVSAKSIHYFLMLLLSFAVVAALRSVGVLLVVAMLITPASTALLLNHRLQYVLSLSALIGLVSSIMGVVFSIVWDMPPGPAIVLTATGIYILASIFAPDRGLLMSQVRKFKQRIKILGEDIVKDLSKGATLKSQNKNFATHLAMRQLVVDGYIDSTNIPNLTAKGLEMGRQLVRAHRLWETYQVDKMGLAAHQIHDDAERLEHLLTKEQTNELHTKLGNPTTDPHGSPIPILQDMVQKSLLSLKPKSRSSIAAHQLNEHVESELWERGLSPHSKFTVVRIETDKIIINHSNKQMAIPAELAGMIRVV